MPRKSFKCSGTYEYTVIAKNEVEARRKALLSLEEDLDGGNLDIDIEEMQE